MTNDQNQNPAQNKKYSCGLVRDLIPLYRDNVCGEDSRKIVEEHITECSECADILEQLSDPVIKDIEEKLSAETSAVLEKHHKREHRTAVTAGLITSGIFLIPLIVCLIVNLASGNGLGWFYIVLSSLMTAASITVVPMMSAEYKLPKTVGAFTFSVIALLSSCCLYTHGDWLFIAAVPVVFGISLFFAPFIIREIPLPDTLKNRKTLIVVLWDVFWLLAVLAVCCIHTKGDWFFTAAIAVIFGLSVILMPILIKQIPLPEPLKNHKALLVMTWDSAWLYILLLYCSRYANGPALNYLHNSIWITAVCLLVPWTMLVLIRYTKLQPLIKTGLCILIPALFGIAADDIITLIYYPRSETYSPSFLKSLFNVVFYHAYMDTGFTVTAIVFSSVISLGLILILVGTLIAVRRKNKK